MHTKVIRLWKILEGAVTYAFETSQNRSAFYKPFKLTSPLDDLILAMIDPGIEFHWSRPFF